MKFDCLQKKCVTSQEDIINPAFFWKLIDVFCILECKFMKATVLKAIVVFDDFVILACKGFVSCFF